MNTFGEKRLNIIHGEIQTLSKLRISAQAQKPYADERETKIQKKITSVHHSWNKYTSDVLLHHDPDIGVILYCQVSDPQHHSRSLYTTALSNWSQFLSKCHLKYVRFLPSILKKIRRREFSNLSIRQTVNVLCETLNSSLLASTCDCCQ